MTITIEVNEANHALLMRTVPLRSEPNGDVSFTLDEAVEFHASLGRAIKQAEEMNWPKEARSK
jgi:hypothetical protein